MSTLQMNPIQALSIVADFATLASLLKAILISTKKNEKPKDESQGIKKLQWLPFIVIITMTLLSSALLLSEYLDPDIQVGIWEKTSFVISYHYCPVKVD